MRMLKILLPLIICMLLSGCIKNAENESANDIKLGKNITVTISEGEVIDAEYLQAVLDGKVEEDASSFHLWGDEELTKLIEYMRENDFAIKPGTYTFNQAWKFDAGEFVPNNGEKRKVFEFIQRISD